MADTVLPSIATVNPAQLAELLHTYGNEAGFKAAMVRHMINDIRATRQAEVQEQYQNAVAALDAQEAAAMANIEDLLNSLIAG